MTWLYVFDLIGCGVFAVSGAILAYRQKMDGMGVLVLAGVTAIGGGTIRDLLLDAPVFWLTEPSYIYSIVITSVLSTIWLNHIKRIPEKSLELADALGLALFVVMGTQKALEYGVAEVTAIIMGMMTGCFGGMIRDVLANNVPFILKKELYAMCCIAGGSVYILTIPWFDSKQVAAILAFCTVFLLRLAAIKWKWQIHVFKYDES